MAGGIEIGAHFLIFEPNGQLIAEKSQSSP
jgi:hypothetical protein